MATEVQPAPQRERSTAANRRRDEVESRPNAGPDAGGKPVRRRSWKGVLIGLVVIGAVSAVIFYSLGASSPSNSGPKLTHTIRRGDLLVTVTEQGTLESSNNTEIRCKVRGTSTVLWVIEAGTHVKPGDELVRLDTSLIEDNINQQKIIYERARADFTQFEADVAVAKIAVTEYLEGTFRSEMKTLEKDLKVAESNLRAAQNMLEHTERMFRKGYVNQLEVERQRFTVEQSLLELEVKQTQIEVLDKFTRAKQMEELQSKLTAAEAKLASAKAALDLEKARLDRETQQLQNCVIRAETSGMVILPSAAERKETPDIEEGATVREDQVLLMIPDLSKMQVKVGIHESKIDQITPGMPARITLREMTIDGSVSSVASVTRPAGWWTGNVVKYDTIIAVSSLEGLKPGMSAEVEVIIAEHEDVVTVPVAAVLESEQGHFCWVKSENSPPQRRAVQLGDSNDQFIVVKAGLKEGDQVVLNPLAFIDEAQSAALKPLSEYKRKAEENQADKTDKQQPEKESQQTDQGLADPAGA